LSIAFLCFLRIIFDFVQLILHAAVLAQKKKAEPSLCPYLLMQIT